MGAARASAHALEMTTRSTAVTVAGRHGPARSHPALPSRGQSTARALPPRPAMRAVYAYHLGARHGLAPTRARLSSRGTGTHSALPGSAHTQQWLSHGSAPVAWSAMVHATAGVLDAIAVAPVRPAGPIRAALEVYDTPSREGRQGGGRIVRPPAGLGRWRAHGDRLPAPRAPAQRRRPRPAARGPAMRPRPDSRRPPGAAGRARGGARRTRRAGTPARPRPQGSLGGSLPLRVYHSRPGANARGARAHQSGAFLPL